MLSSHLFVAENHLMLCDLVLYVVTFEYESKLLQSQALCLVIPMPNSDPKSKNYHIAHVGLKPTPFMS